MALPLIPIIGGVLMLLGIWGRRLGLDPFGSPQVPVSSPSMRPTIVHNHYHGFGPNGSPVPPAIEIEQDEPRPKRGRPQKRHSQHVVDPNPYEVEDEAEPATEEVKNE